jgi:hypothetical protein
MCRCCCGHSGSTYFFLGTPATSGYPQPPPRTGSPEFVNAGRNLYFIHCAVPHSGRSCVLSRPKPPQHRRLDRRHEGGRGERSATAARMPRFGDTLSPGDVTALQAYFIDQWWQSYDAVPLTKLAIPEQSHAISCETLARFQKNLTLRSSFDGRSAIKQREILSRQP